MLRVIVLWLGILLLAALTLDEFLPVNNKFAVDVIAPVLTKVPGSVMFQWLAAIVLIVIGFAI